MNATKQKQTKPANGKPQRKPRAKQPYLPGAEDMAPKTIPALDEAAEDYRNARDARMRMGETEQQCAEDLLKLMQEHKLTEYEYEGKVVRLVDVLKVKVTKQKAKEAETDNGEAE